MPAASACLSQTQRNAIASAEASIARLRNQLAALAVQLGGGWCIRPTWARFVERNRASETGAINARQTIPESSNRLSAAIGDRVALNQSTFAGLQVRCSHAS